MKAIAIFTRNRAPMLPKLASAHEQGFTDFEASTWFGFFLPKGTPVPIIQRLHDATVAAMDTPSVQERLIESGSLGSAPSGSPRPLDSVRLLPPLPDPDKIVCIGLNYRSHAEESGQQVPAVPTVFTKFPSAVIAPDAPIVLPADSSQVDYEGELAVVIGDGGRHIAESDALAPLINVRRSQPWAVLTSQYSPSASR